MPRNGPQRAFQRVGLLPPALAAFLATALLAGAQTPSGPTESFEHWSGLARQAGETKNFTKLVQAYSEMAALRPREAWIHRGLGLAYHMQGMNLEAIPPLEKALTLDAALPGAALYLGISYYRANRFAEAAATLAEAPEITDDQHLAHYWLGAARRAIGKNRQAIASLEQAAELSPEDLEGLHLLARSYAEYSDELHATLSKIAPDSAAAHLLAAKDLVADGVWQAALAAVDRAIAADAGFAEAHVVKARIHSRDGRGYPEAGPFFKEFDEKAGLRNPSDARRVHGMVDASPDNPDALYELGEIYARLSRQTAETLLDLYPDSYRARLLRGEAFEKGARLEFDKALAEFHKAAELRPDAPGVQYAVGRVLWKMNRFDEAAVHLAKELAENPHHGTAHFLLGKTHLNQGRPGKALEHLRAAVNARPELFEARRSLAQALVKQGLYDEGIAAYRDLLRDRPDDAGVHALLAAAFRSAGRIEEAKSSARTAQRLRATPSRRRSGETTDAELGRTALARGDYAAADVHFKKASETADEDDLPRFAEAWAKALRALGREAGACDILRDAARVEPVPPSLLYEAGICALSSATRVSRENGGESDAADLLERTYRGGVRHSAATLALGRAYLARGRDGDAVDLLLPFAEHSRSAAALRKVGRLFFDYLLYRQAIEVFVKAEQIEPGHYETGMYRALSHFQLEEYSSAAEVLRAIAPAVPPVEYRYLLGSALARVGHWEEAARELARAAEQAPERASSDLHLGMFHLERGDVEQALGRLEQGAAKMSGGAKLFYVIQSRTNCSGLAPPSDTKRGRVEQARLLSSFGQTLLAGRHWGSALEVFLLALDRNPAAAEPYGAIGLVCQELGTPRVGLAFVEAGLSLHPDNADLHYYAGSLREYSSRPKAAWESYGRAIDLAGPKAPARYWIRLGIAENLLGRREQAETAFQTALEVEADSAESFYQLGKHYLSEKRYAPAEKLLEKAVRLAPSMREAYYSYGLALVRNGKPEKGRAVLARHRRRQAIRDSQVRSGGMTPP